MNVNPKGTRHGLSKRLGLELLEPRLALSATITRNLNVSKMQEVGQAAYTGTKTDIGAVADIFDRNVDTLMRTDAINPAIVDLSFSSTQSIRAFYVYVSLPQHQWKIQAADNLSDLDSQTGSYFEIVPWTFTLGKEYSPVVLAEAKSAKVLRLTVQRLAGDSFVHIYEWGVIANLDIESIAVSPAHFSIESGATQQLEAEAFTATGIPYPLGDQGVWSSSNPQVASVNSAGLAKGAAGGTAQLVVSLGDVQGASVATVTGPNLPPGDYNGNQVVEGTDFLQWQRSFGAVVVPAGSGADGTNDGRVDEADLAIWASGGGSASAAMHASQASSITASETANTNIQDFWAGAVQTLNLYDRAQTSEPASDESWRSAFAALGDRSQSYSWLGQDIPPPLVGGAPTLDVSYALAHDIDAALAPMIWDGFGLHALFRDALKAQ